MDAELLEIIAAIGQLLGKRMLMHVMPSQLAEQTPWTAGDQRVEMQFALLLGLIVGALGVGQARRPGDHGIGRAHVLGAVRTVICMRHVAHIAP